MLIRRSIQLLFFVNATATTEIYTLSLHDALPIFNGSHAEAVNDRWAFKLAAGYLTQDPLDRKSTRLNSSHVEISYAVFCLKKKKKKKTKSIAHSNIHTPGH